MINIGVDLNPGVKTIYGSSLNDARKELISDALAQRNPQQALEQKFQGDNLSRSVREWEEKKEKIDRDKNLSKYLMILGEAAAGRGVPKAIQSPAQQMNLYPQNPKYFGLQMKHPIPYQKVLNNGNNLKAVMKGYQEVRKLNGILPDDAANIIASAQRREGLINEVFNKQRNESIYAGISTDAAKHLYNIHVKNQRENSIYAFQ